ncbi:hypothetical protein H8S20_09225 [Clostridium sp. NSJ-6]|uniref:Uncharacterized protein n=1 Tax=Clostridium hominis TaxID=2763036 RepID=A0ABR7DCE1_9CLOT|nr:hypothetical protein [Clostridium hominis]MBC5629072.1 hypothetical protein [Clostridium hominis]MDU2671868.1 hypothetical protein [Clostridium sp.]
MREEKVRENSRLIPVGDGILRNKKFNMDVYILLDSISRWNSHGEDNYRYIYEDDLIVSTLAKKINMSRSTFKKILDEFESNEIIQFANLDERNIYILKDWYDKYLLFSGDFLKKLLQLKHKHLIKIYIVYYKYSKHYGKCTLDQKKILQEIGLQYNSDNLAKLREINKALINVGLIKIIRTTKRENRVNKTILHITADPYYETRFYKNDIAL